tara:strand:- start:2936 stop:7312 length:4377 start_codon:yes stop_codon:yes gene_type:complete
MRKARKILLWTLFALLLLAGSLFIALQFSSIQTFIGHQTGKYLSKQLGTKISIKSLKIDLWDSILLEDVLIRDSKKDTLVYIQGFNTGSFLLDLEKKSIFINKITLEAPLFKMAIYEGESDNNLQFLLDSLSSDFQSEGEWKIEVTDLNLMKGRYEYQDFNYADSLSGTLNSHRIRITDLYADLSRFQIIGDSILFKSNSLSAVESSELAISKLNSNVTIAPSGISFMDASFFLNHSDLSGNILLKTGSFGSYSSYLSDVKHDITFHNSTLNLVDLNRFSANSKFSDLELKMEGTFKGKINKLKGKKISLQLANNTNFIGDISLNGLPELAQTFIDLDVKQLNSSREDIQTLILPALGVTNVNLPLNLNALGNFNFSGNFTGFTNDFVAYGELSSPIGKLITDLKFKEISGDKRYSYSGELTSKKFDLAQLYNSKNLGVISSTISVKGKGITKELVEIDLEGEVSSISFGKTSFSDISANGSLQNNFFSGNLVSKDKNADFEFSGVVDFRESIPWYSFSSKIEHLNLTHYIDGLDKISTLKTNLSVEGSGSNPDNITGEICLENTEFSTGESSVKINSIFLHSSLSPERDIILESDIIKGELKGKYTYDQIMNSVARIAENFSPNITSDSLIPAGNFSLALNVIDFQKLRSYLGKEIYVSQGSNLYYSENGQNSHLLIETDTVSYHGVSLDYLNLDYHKLTEEISINMNSSELNINNQFNVIQPILTSEGTKHGLKSNFSWNDREKTSSGDIYFSYSLDSNNYTLEFSSGDLYAGPAHWNILPNGKFLTDGSEFSFENLILQNEDQQIFVNGSLNDGNKTDFILENIDLSSINYFTSSGSAQLNGILNGSLVLSDSLNSNEAISSFTLNDFMLDEVVLGNISTTGKWNSDQKVIELSGELTNNDHRPFSFSGTYSPSEDENPLDLKLTAKEFKLNFLSSIVKSAVSEFGGSLSGSIDVKGTLSKPLLHGDLSFNDAEVKIDFLNTSYTLRDAIKITPDMFLLENIEIVDPEGNVGNIIGTVVHENFREWSYDFFIDMEKTPFLCLNTTEDQNELFYGKAYGSGFVSIFGYDDFLEINANASAEEGTIINMPLGDSDEVTFEDFVSFAIPEEKIKNNGLSQLQSDFNLSIDLEIDVKKEAVFKMIFDQVTGDVLEGRGKGHLSMIVNDDDDFQMYGTIEIVEGEYLFTLQNIINKAFEIKPGGTISWYGDPFLADINLRTVYRLSAPLYDVIGTSDNNESYKKRVPVNLVMNLDGKLLNPGIAFDIDLPTSDEITKSRVNSAMGTEQEKNRQAFSLLVLKKFLPTTSFSSFELGIAENSTEFLSSQLNNWLSQITDEVDIGLNYRPGDEISNQEIALALSTQLFSDKLYISGNLGVTRGNKRNHNPNTLIGDVRLEYLLGKDGKIRLLVYNDSNNFDINTTSYETSSTQGAGILYKEEFESWDEFVSNFKKLLTSKKKL